MQKSIKQLLNESSTIFWDFDGVIKDSVAVKTFAFQKFEVSKHTETTN